MRKLWSGIGLIACMAFVFSCSSKQETADYRVVPLPKTISVQTGKPFVLDNQVRILYPEGNADMKRNAEFLKAYIQESTGK